MVEKNRLCVHSTHLRFTVVYINRRLGAYRTAFRLFADCGHVTKQEKVIVFLKHFAGS